MGIDIADGVSLDPQTVMTGRCCIIGQSGSGKSYLIGVIAEELCRNQLPFMIIDTEGEYGSLKSAFKVIWIGGTGADVGIDTDYDKLVRLSIERGVPVVFDVSEALDKQAYVESVLGSVYSVEEKMRTPYLVIVEEANKFAPQATHRGTNMIEEIGVRGRKRGIGLVVATQRPATISKTLLAQCSYGFIGRLAIENDIGAIDMLLGSRNMLRDIPKLKSGEFIPFGIGKSAMLHVKERIAEPGGTTPALKRGAAQGKELGKLISELRSSKRAATQKPSVKGDISIDVIKENFDIDYAKEYAERVMKKRFGLFGRPKENLDSLKEHYARLFLCRIRTPTRNREEFEESFLLVDPKLNFVTMAGSVAVTGGAGKQIRLGDADRQVLAAMANGKAMDRNDLSSLTGIERGRLSRILYKLEKAGFIDWDSSGRAAIVDRRRFLSQNPPQTTDKRVGADEVEEGGGPRKMAEGVKAFVEGAFPGAMVLGIDEVFLPVYRITLRHGNRIRLFAVDAVFGKQVAQD